jgi:PKD repeat protein
MKQLLYLVASLIIIVAIIPPSSASYTCNYGNQSGEITATQRIIPGFATTEELDAVCMAHCGVVSSGNVLAIKATDKTSGSLTNIRTSGYGNYTVSDFYFNGNYAVWYRQIYCDGSKYTGIDNTGCGISSQNNPLYMDVFYKIPLDTDYWAAGTIPLYEVNFTGTPTTGPSPLSVLFTISNFTYINATGGSWAFGDGNLTTSTANPISHLYQNPGTYSVGLNFYNLSGSPLNSLLKTNYIVVGAPNATKTKWFQTIDGTNGNIIKNSSIQLKDIENSSWVNATGLIDDGMSSITTLEGHTINAYAQALGFSDADDLSILNDGTPRYIMMWPTFAKNVSDGNVSLYVTVQDKDTRAAIVGAGVTISPSKGSAQSTTTNGAGIAYFIVTNSTDVYITATAPGMGYKPAVTTINTGTGSGGSASAAATILLSKGLVTPTFPTVTTLPGGGTPTPTTTILPGCEDQISAAGQEKCRAAQSNQGLSFLSGNLLGLIQICFVVTILYLLGIKLGK